MSCLPCPEVPNFILGERLMMWHDHGVTIRKYKSLFLLIAIRMTPVHVGDPFLDSRRIGCFELEYAQNPSIILHISFAPDHPWS